MAEKKKLTTKEILERSIKNTKKILKSGRRLPSETNKEGVKIGKTERVELQNRLKTMVKKLAKMDDKKPNSSTNNNSYDYSERDTNTIGEPGTVTDTGSGLQGGRKPKPTDEPDMPSSPTSKPKTTSKPTSISPDNEVPKRFSEASGRKAIRDVLGDDTLVEYEDMSEAANFKKGGSVKKTEKSRYGMRSGGFTKRGGIYKKGAA
tara:strand:- start:687 stop:1301 length:615 start_codon:yes stop_codon:yes gene_type:complete